MTSDFHRSRDLRWSHGEKKSARSAFDTALAREGAAVRGEVEAMLRRSADPDEIWRVHDFLSDKRREFERKYDYRYSVLIGVFGRLLYEGWLKEDDLAGLGPEKIPLIQRTAATLKELHGSPPRARGGPEGRLESDRGAQAASGASAPSRQRTETATAKDSESRLYQIKVTLDGIRPPVWRRLLVPSSISLRKLHRILQTAIGWTDSHLHQFEARGQTFGIPDSESGEDARNEAGVRLDQVMLREGDTMVYEYDFGDGWSHTIVLEAIGEPARGVEIPSCIGGARACPPEDCGGIHGYKEFLKAVGDPSHPDHSEMLEWLGGPFDAEKFDLEKINKLLAPRRRRA